MLDVGIWLARQCGMPMRLAFLTLLVAVCAGCGLIETEAGLACQEPPDGGLVGDREVPDVTGLGPDLAAATLDRAEVGVSWRYSYLTELGGPGGYSECWCVPPPDGVVEDVSTSDEGWLIVFVRRPEPMIGGRPQPRIGWGCPS